MKSIEKLRELAEYIYINNMQIIDHLDAIGRCMLRTEWLDSWHKAFDAACDEIEREIAERYMELPVDADGVPIHCCDRMRLDNGHEGEVWLIGVFDIMMSDHTCFDWAKSHHVKPRTIEDVLRDMEGMRGNNATYEDVVRRCAELAAELRELMEASE